MDPITIIGLLASITNLIHASKTTLKVINDFRDGDTDIQNLANDITVFTEALSGFERVFRSGRTTHHIAEDVVKVMIQSSLETMTSLERRLLQISAHQTSAVRRMKWVQSSSAIKKLREQLKEQNAMLQTFLSITHAETFITILSQYPSLSLADDETVIGVECLESTTYLKAPPDPRHSRRLSDSTSTTTTESISAPSASSTDLTQYSSASSSSISGHSRSTPENAFSSEVNLFSTLSTTENTQGYPSSGQALRVRQACHYKCYCTCHAENAKPPRRGLGKLKSARLSCTDPTCLSYTTVDEKYRRYSKSIFGALSQAVSSHNIRVRYNLNTYRMVSEGCDAMRFVKHGNLNNLKACIQSGQATIWDTAQDGWSLLHTAAYHRQFPIVKYLIELGADIESGDFASRTPADLAVLKSLGQDATQVEHNVFGLFSEKNDILIDFDFTPLHIAVLELYPASDDERPPLETLITLVDDANNAPANTNWTEWKLRFKNRSPLLGDVIEYFRSSAYELPPQSKIIHNLIDQKDKKFHWSPLHWATFSGRRDKMKSLVEYGANPLQLSNLNANILHTAAESKLSHGLTAALEIWRRCSDQLNINQINRWGETPLHVASWCSPACVELLLEAGANPSLQQEDGQVPLHHVGLCEKGPDRRKMVSLLCCTTIKDHINTQDVYGRPPILEFLDDLECIEILLSSGARLDIIDCAGKNIFHHVCLQGDFKLLRVLLHHSAKAGEVALAAETDYSGNTPLIDALSNANIRCAMEMLALENVGNIISKDGWAAVHYAAKIGDPDLLEAVFHHSSFMMNMKTLDGKGVDTVAMEAGTWSGKVKELTRKKGSNMTGNPKANAVSQAAQDIIDNGYAVVQLSNLETERLHHAIRHAVEFFRRPLEHKLVHGSIDHHYGYRPFGMEHSISSERPDRNECFTVWSDRMDRIPSAQGIAELISSFLDWRDPLAPLVKGILNEIAKSFGAEAAPSFQKASHLQINKSLPTPLEQDMLQEKHADGNMVTVIHSNAPGLEIHIKGGGSEVVLPVLGARNEVVLLPGSALTTLTGGGIAPLYHHVRNHSLDRRQSLMYFVNPEIDEPLYSWVKSSKGELTDIREHVQDAPLMFGLPPAEAL